MNMKSNLTYTSVASTRAPGLLNAVTNALKAGGFETVAGTESLSSAVTGLTSVFGGESFQGAAIQGVVKNLSEAQKIAASLSAQTASTDVRVDSQANNNFLLMCGAEGFAAQNTKGETGVLTAASITLNALTNCQTEAANALYPVVPMPYEQEAISFSVRTAGLGRYVYAASAFNKASDHRPITDIIRDMDFFMGDDLKLVPVFPKDATAKTRNFFVKEADFTPWSVNYDSGDAYHRQSHLTNFLTVPVSIPNYLGLMETPNQTKFDHSTDQIESNGIQLKELLLKIKVDGEEKTIRLRTNTMPGVSLIPTNNGQSSDDRQLSFVARSLIPGSFVEASSDTVTDIFKDLQVNGLRPYFELHLNANFQRQNNQFNVQGGTFRLSHFVDADGTRINEDTENEDIEKLFALVTEGRIVGAYFSQNATNTNRANLGYRIEIYDAIKTLSTRRQTPISTKFPVSKDDVNQESLNDAVDQMAVAINNQMSALAFRTATDHFNALYEINGAPIVGSDQGNDVLPAQHFVNVTAIRRTKSIKDMVSTLDSKDVLPNISAALVNELSEMAAALATKSGLASINEYSNLKEMDWTIVVHQNLAQYIFRQGDIHTLGFGGKATVVITNFDKFTGKIWLVPTHKTSGTNIDVLGGLGVTLTKENIVIDAAQLTRDNRDFGLIMTQPSYSHHNLGCIMGELVIEDAKEATNEQGLITDATIQRVKLSSGTTTGK